MPPPTCRRAPSSITGDARTLELDYGDADKALLTAELLRIYSPSARGAGSLRGGAVLQTGKKYVSIEEVTAIGQLRIRIAFDDGHDTGIYSWSFLKELYDRREAYWQSYLAELDKANASRLPTIPIGQWTPPAR